MKKKRFFRHFAGLAGGVMMCFLLLCSGAYAIDIKEVSSTGGVRGWLVEDHTVPIVAIQFSFKGGSAQDPADREGLANLLSGLFDEGAGNLDSGAFQARMDDLGGDLSFAANDDTMRGSLRVLAENRDQAVNLLALAVQKPRFGQEAVNRIREQLITALRASERDPSTIAQKKFASMIYGKHPYGRWSEGTPETLGKISREDLIATHAKLFARDNVKIGIVGPVTEEEAKKIIGQVFDPLPPKAGLRPIPQAQLRLGGMTTVNYNMPQTSITLVYPGVKRNEPDFFAAYLMNYILGGPGLTSRLFSEVREKQGLAYNVNSSLLNRDYAAGLVISTGTRAEQAQKSLATIRKEVRRMVEDGVNAKELTAAKSFAIGSYAVQNMRSSTDIAATLVGLQEQNLPIDYIEKRRGLIDAVTLKQVNAVARKLLTAEPAILMVGPMKN